MAGPRPEPGSWQETELFGANARARGEPQSANPYRNPVLPGDQARPAQEREWKMRHWDIGWMAEDLLRGGPKTVSGVFEYPPKNDAND